MINIKVEGTKTVEAMMRAVPGKARRAAVVALTKTGQDIKKAEIEEMQKVFDNPVRYTTNSLRLTPATKARPQATVWFKEPERMGQHYLVPQVEGGVRKLKGHERGIKLGQLHPTKYARKTKAGNMSPGQIRQIMSVLRLAEQYAGYQANITARSARRNTKTRDYVVIRNRRGRLYPGVYERVAIKGKGIGGKTRRTLADKSKAYQRGQKRGRYSSVIRGRGLKPVMMKGQQGKAVRPLLDFYGVAHRVSRKRFEAHFWRTFEQYMKS